MENYSLSDASAKIKDIALNVFGANNPNTQTISLIQAIGTAILHSVNNSILTAEKKTDIDNMVGAELDQEGEKYNVIRQQPSQSEGVVVFNSQNSLAQIGSGVALIYNGNTYTSQSPSITQDITFGNITQTSLITKIETFASTKLVIVYCDNHGLSKNIKIEGVGFGISGLDGAQTITEFDKNSFRFINQSISSTTVITSFLNTEYFSARVVKCNIISSFTGKISSIKRGEEVFLQNPILNIENSGFVDYNEIGIGADRETDDNYRVRIKAAKKSIGSISDIKELVLNQPGITRMSLLQNYPIDGKFTVCFLRDNDSTIIPTQQELDVVYNLLTDEDVLNPNITAGKVNVEEPIEIIRNIKIQGLSPGTDIMKEAVSAKLRSIIYNIGIQDGTMSEKLPEDIKIELIKNTIDSLGNSITGLANVFVFLQDNITPSNLFINNKEFITVQDIMFI